MQSDDNLARQVSTELRELLARARDGKVLIVGAGVTGRAGAKLFRDAGYRVAVCDERELDSAMRSKLGTVEIWDAITPDKLRSSCGAEPVTFAVASPGFNPRGPVLSTLRACGVPVLSELDVALPFLGQPQVAVTGTNGKTTTVHVIAQMLERGGIAAELVGNVGTPFIERVSSLSLQEAAAEPAERRMGAAARPCFVSELSSYQLETVRHFRPRVAALLNAEDDHLERHGTFDEYLRVKLRIFAEQDPATDWSILFAGDHWFHRALEAARGRPLPFGVWREELDRFPDLSVYHPQSREIELRIHGESERYSTASSKLLGSHNKLNLCAAVASARLSGVPKNAVQAVIEEFLPLEHRVEPVRELNGVRYINDSKGTNVSAVAVALDAVTEDLPGNGDGRVILLLGGKLKEGSWEPVTRRLPQTVRMVIAFGGDGDQVIEALERSGGALPCPVERVPWLADAIDLAHKSARPNDIVLLSPGCASFDAYSDYTARGRHFRELVRAL